MRVAEMNMILVMRYLSTLFNYPVVRVLAIKDFLDKLVITSDGRKSKVVLESVDLEKLCFWCFTSTVNTLTNCNETPSWYIPAIQRII